MPDLAPEEIIDRAAVAERRARLAEISTQAQTRIVNEALRAVETLEQQLAAVRAEKEELERRLTEQEAAPQRQPPPVPAGLETRARAQAAAAAAAEGSAGTPSPERIRADLDAAAAALKRGREAGPTIVPAARQPARADVIGASKRSLPGLRGALVKLAHDDPQTAAQLLVGLLPAQGPLVAEALDYDISLAEAGTFAVSIAGDRAWVKPIDEPRGRAGADFHVSTDAITLAELLAGEHHHAGRIGGRLRIAGRRRQARSLWAITDASMSLAEAVAAGARLEPGPVLRALAYAIHPVWTKGHSFTVEQAIGEERFFVTAADGAPLDVGTVAPLGGADATVTMSRAIFDRLLAGGPVPVDARPSVRGNAAAVALLKAWTDRARGD